MASIGTSYGTLSIAAAPNNATESGLTVTFDRGALASVSGTADTTKLVVRGTTLQVTLPKDGSLRDLPNDAVAIDVSGSTVGRIDNADLASADTLRPTAAGGALTVSTDAPIHSLEERDPQGRVTVATSDLGAIRQLGGDVSEVPKPDSAPALNSALKAGAAAPATASTAAARRTSWRPTSTTRSRGTSRAATSTPFGGRSRTARFRSVASRRSIRTLRFVSMLTAPTPSAPSPADSKLGKDPHVAR